jgi:hypothetical protein
VRPLEAGRIRVGKRLGERELWYVAFAFHKPYPHGLGAMIYTAPSWNAALAIVWHLAINLPEQESLERAQILRRPPQAWMMEGANQ